MTTLRIEVGRHCSTRISDVVEGLIRAGCMKSIEIDPSAQAFLPIDELKAALEAELFYVDLVSWPEPPPPSLWRRTRAIPGRVYRWGRRVILRESHMDQYLAAYDSPALHRVMMRESPFLAKIRKDSE